jgi:hypothetical protein
MVPGALSIGVKRRGGGEADLSPPSRVEVWNGWSCTSTPAIRRRGVVLSSAQGRLYLYIHLLDAILSKKEGLWGSFCGVKRPGRVADLSPPSRVEVWNAWSYTSTTPYTFMAWCLVKHRGDFTSLCVGRTSHVSVGVMPWTCIRDILGSLLSQSAEVLYTGTVWKRLQVTKYAAHLYFRSNHWSNEIFFALILRRS